MRLRLRVAWGGAGGFMLPLLRCCTPASGVRVARCEPLLRSNLMRDRKVALAGGRLAIAAMDLQRSPYGNPSGAPRSVYGWVRAMQQ